MTYEAFENAIMVDMALESSTNTVLHLLAIASQLGIELPPELFDKISRETPLMRYGPSQTHTVKDLDEAVEYQPFSKSLEITSIKTC